MSANAKEKRIQSYRLAIDMIRTDSSKPRTAVCRFFGVSCSIPIALVELGWLEPGRRGNWIGPNELTDDHIVAVMERVSDRIREMADAAMAVQPQIQQAIPLQHDEAQHYHGDDADLSRELAEIRNMVERLMKHLGVAA